MIFSILIWKEFPSTHQWIRNFLPYTLVSILNLSLILGHRSSLEKFDIKPTIMLLFIFGGMAEFSSKSYQKNMPK